MYSPGQPADWSALARGAQQGQANFMQYMDVARRLRELEGLPAPTTGVGGMLQSYYDFRSIPANLRSDAAGSLMSKFGAKKATAPGPASGTGEDLPMETSDFIKKGGLKSL